MPEPAWRQELVASLAEANNPRRKLIRARRQSRQRIVFRGLATLGFAWWTSVVGTHPGVEGSEIFLGGVTGMFGVGTVAAAGRWSRLQRVPLPPRSAEPAADLPPDGSVARVPLERLANRERALGELLALVGPVGEDVSAEAARAAVTLRDYAVRVRAVEAARDGAQGEAAQGLEAAVAALRQRLEEGVSAYDRLVAVAAEAVSAGSVGTVDELALRRLEDAADTLAGLARGLREVRATGERPGPSALPGPARLPAVAPADRPAAALESGAARPVDPADPGPVTSG